MAAGLLAGCGGTSDGQEDISCASGATCEEAAEPGSRTELNFPTFICCDGTECTNTAGFCARYCSQNERGGICS
ncbi:hypothetical protein DAT35_04330 [Vitiosangium sp. GDMCC 1.1324]|nr:hypothetical protein DAT35_04330 [Vitiosangium sp. GDMCC 1.1324]